MSTTTITCPHCRTSFEISDAIQRQIDDELTRTREDLTHQLRTELEQEAQAATQRAVERAIRQEQERARLREEEVTDLAQLQLEKAQQATRREVDKARQAFELEQERLRQEAQHSKENEKKLRERQTALLEELSAATLAREEAELNARKQLLERERLIREEAVQRASEDFNTKIREQEETINRLREQLTTAKQVAEQGSQQLQGEILELDVERSLKAAFPMDTIEEVKKGERGSDIRHVVNEPYYPGCGLILWECKNAKNFQAAWLNKLKDELVSEKAQIGVIVFQSPDTADEGFQQLADNIWQVRPRHAAMLATLLREVLIKVAIANRNAEGKDVKTELIYNYLTGGEFSNRIRYILESYDEMAKQLEQEKRQAQRRWAAQEKTLEKVIGSLYAMSGDLQGIAGQEVIALPAMGEEGAGP